MEGEVSKLGSSVQILKPATPPPSMHKHYLLGDQRVVLRDEPPQRRLRLLYQRPQLRQGAGLPPVEAHVVQVHGTAPYVARDLVVQGQGRLPVARLFRICRGWAGSVDRFNTPSLTHVSHRIPIPKLGHTGSAYLHARRHLPQRVVRIHHLRVPLHHARQPARVRHVPKPLDGAPRKGPEGAEGLETLFKRDLFRVVCGRMIRALIGADGRRPRRKHTNPEQTQPGAYVLGGEVLPGLVHQVPDPKRAKHGKVC